MIIAYETLIRKSERKRLIKTCKYKWEENSEKNLRNRWYENVDQTELTKSRVQLQAHVVTVIRKMYKSDCYLWFFQR
jgi:ribulose kinase